MTSKKDITKEPDYCRSCMIEAKGVLGIYSSNEKVPRNLLTKLEAEYDNQHYNTHDVEKKPISN
jgi:hypothetical protein